jgi:hypothetical protein
MPALPTDRASGAPNMCELPNMCEFITMFEVVKWGWPPLSNIAHIARCSDRGVEDLIAVLGVDIE